MKIISQEWPQPNTLRELESTKVTVGMKQLTKYDIGLEKGTL